MRSERVELFLRAPRRVDSVVGLGMREEPSGGDEGTATCEGETSSLGEEGRLPDECTELGLWEVEPLYYSLNGRSNDRNRRGKAFRSRSAR